MFTQGGSPADFAVEAAFFPPGRRVMTLAALPSVPLRLAAAGYFVTAVGNSDEVNALRHMERLPESAQPFRQPPILHQLQAADRPAFWAFLNLADPQQQVKQWWKMTVDPRGGWRPIVNALTDAANLRRLYQLPTSTAPSAVANLGELLMRQLEDHLRRRPNRDNPWVRQLLLDWPTLGAVNTASSNADIASRLRLVVAEPAVYLADQPSGRFHGISLVHHLDHGTCGTCDTCDTRIASPASTPCHQLIAAAKHASDRRAWMILRSTGEAQNDRETYWARFDRSMIWGRIITAKLHAPEAIVPAP